MSKMRDRLSPFNKETASRFVLFQLFAAINDYEAADLCVF